MLYDKGAPSEVRIVEYDPETQRVARNGFAQFVPVGTNLVFVDHHDKVVITYDMGSKEAVSSLLSWRLPAGLLSDETAYDKAAHERKDRPILGSFRRSDGRVVVVRELTDKRLEDGTARGLRIASFVGKPQPGDRPLVRDTFIADTDDGVPAEVVQALDAAPPSSADYATFDAIVVPK